MIAVLVVALCFRPQVVVAFDESSAALPTAAAVADTAPTAAEAPPVATIQTNANAAAAAKKGPKSASDW